MNTLESLGNQISQITMYDIKSMYEQAKNVVLNVSECEAKVREATNDEPWGASSTLMQDIANRTFNYADFNEIMPSIYSRFMEKEARQWRQIYKSLQLLEYLIKNGSERVVDDARSHVHTIKMLRNFHFIDDSGKDQGINVRNRSRELVELLSDVEKIRSERRKAKANKHKYTGAGNDGGLGFSGGGSRYGGFGSESFNDHYSGYNGGGSSNYSGGGAGGSSGGFRDSSSRGGFEEYDAGGDELASPSSPRGSSSYARRKEDQPVSKPKEEPKLKEPEPDLLGGFDDSGPAPAATSPPGGAKSSGLLDDDFADFVEAPTSPTSAAATAPATSAANPNAALLGLFNATPIAATPQQRPPVSGGGMAMGMGMGMGSGMATNFTAQPQAPAMGTQNMMMGHRPMGSMGGGMGLMQPQSTPMTPNSTPTAPKPPAQPSKGNANFDDLWNLGLGGTSKTQSQAPKKSMLEMQKEKANSSLWGAGGLQQKPQGFNPSMMGGNLGSMGGSSSNNDSLL